MSFLEELENNQEENQEQSSGKTPRQLWEGCFKYFQHFTSILQKEKKSFKSQFNLTFLNTKRNCVIEGPFEIKRMQQDDELKLEIKLNTKLTQEISIKRKDKRSADLLSLKLSKDGILSKVKTDKYNNYIVELNPNIVSIFHIILKDEKKFTIEYKNICSSSKRIIKLPIEKINEANMDELAKYILGQNLHLYTEKISSQEITKIRQQIKLNNTRINEKEKQVKQERAERERLKEIEKSNSIKEKSKKFVFNKSKEAKRKLFGKIINSFKTK